MHSLLTTTTDLLRVVTGSASDLDCIVSFIEYTNASPPVLDALDTQFTNITTATTTTVLGAPTTGSDRRRIKAVSIVNTHATVSTTVRAIIERTGPVNWDLFNTVNLAPGETLTFTEGLGWFHNKITVSVPLVSTSTAVTAAGFAADTYVVGSNLLISGRTKVGTLLEWRINMTKSAASTAVTATIIRFGTAGAIGDTARVTMAGPAQTAAVDEGMLVIRAAVWTAGASGVVRGEQSLEHSAAVAAGFGEMFDGVTSAAFDLTVPALQVGISLNGGTSAAWTLGLVSATAVNLVG
jgi:hypothetical protein